MLLTIGTTGFLLIVVESLGRQFFPQKPDRYLHFPQKTYSVNTRSADLPGVREVAQFSTNYMGLRGTSPRQQDTHILAVGGSTTVCDALDDSKTWPTQLQSKLNKGRKDELIWVGNAGKSGFSVLHHIMFVQKFLESYPFIEAYVFLTGINDLGVALHRKAPHYFEKLSPKQKAWLHRRTFQVRITTPEYWPWYKTWLRLFILQQKQKSTDLGGFYNRRRESRQKTKNILQKPKDILAALTAYEANLTVLIELIQKKGKKIFLMTQPHMWSASPSNRQRQLMWGGCVGLRKSPDHYCYSEGAMEQMLGKFNQRLLEVCAKHRIPCLDLASKLPKSTAVFYDHVHFNEGGAKKVSEEVAHFLYPRLRRVAKTP